MEAKCRTVLQRQLHKRLTKSVLLLSDSLLPLFCISRISERSIIVGNAFRLVLNWLFSCPHGLLRQGLELDVSIFDNLISYAVVILSYQLSSLIKHNPNYY